MEHIHDGDIDIVVGAIHSDLNFFMTQWKAIFSRFHLTIVKDPDLKKDLSIPEGFNLDVYTKTHMDQLLGPSSSVLFSGYACRYFGFLISRKRYIIAFDDDCYPVTDNAGAVTDPVARLIENLTTPATPFYFNTLYDPYRDGVDFVRGYPFGLRAGVKCALSCGLWLNLADLDAPTQALNPELRNTRYVDVVMTVPCGAMMPISGIILGFNRELLGPVLYPGLRLKGEGKVRWETIEDLWSGMCVKVVCDHLGFGVKSGLPYVWRKDSGDVIESLRREWEGVKLMEEIVPFFETLKFPPTAVTPCDCAAEIARRVKEKLGQSHPVFIHAADAMLDWIKLWNKFGSGPPT